MLPLQPRIPGTGRKHGRDPAGRALPGKGGHCQGKGGHCRGGTARMENGLFQNGDWGVSWGKVGTARWALPEGLCWAPQCPPGRSVLPLTELQGWAWPLPTSSGMIGFKAWHVWGLEPGLAALWGLLEVVRDRTRAGILGPAGHGERSCSGALPCPGEGGGGNSAGLRRQEKREAETSGLAVQSAQISFFSFRNQPY